MIQNWVPSRTNFLPSFSAGAGTAEALVLLRVSGWSGVENVVSDLGRLRQGRAADGDELADWSRCHSHCGGFTSAGPDGTGGLRFQLFQCQGRWKVCCQPVKIVEERPLHRGDGVGDLTDACQVLGLGQGYS